MAAAASAWLPAATAAHAQAVEAEPIDPPAETLVEEEPDLDAIYFEPVAIEPFLLTPKRPQLRLPGLPPAVRAMVDEAMKRGEPDTVKTVIEVARRTNPGAGAELDRLEASFRTNRAKLVAAENARKQEALRNAGPFEGWTGKGEFGALRSTGNSTDLGVTAGFKANRIGIDWRHRVTARFDFQRSDGDTTRNRFLVSYEPSFDISKRAFVYGLAQYERDRPQGFDARYSASLGGGYRFFDRDGLKLELKGGPAWRRTQVIEPRLLDEDDSYLAALGALDFEWRFADNLTLTETASAFVHSGNSTYNSLTGIEAGIARRLKARLSYSIEHDTDPPDGTEKTDTLSRFSVIYDF